mgnify:FL=1
MKIQSLDIVVNFYEEDDHVLLNEDGSMNKELMFREAAEWLRKNLGTISEDIETLNIEDEMEIEDPGDSLSVFLNWRMDDEDQEG